MATVQADVRKVWQMTQFKDEIKLGDLTVTVSTIDLAHTGMGVGFETCLFWNQESEVTARYETAAEAIKGHGAFLSPAVIAYVVSNYPLLAEWCGD